MLNKKYNFFKKFSIEITSFEKNRISAYFEQEYKDYSNDTSLQSIGFIKIQKKVTIPIEASILINNQIFMYENTFYYKHEGHILSIVLYDESYEICTDKNFEGSLVFYMHEILMRLYASNFDIVFLHASAFYYKDNTYIVNAFGGTGKTNLVLDAIFTNGKYLADDLTAIDKSSNIYPYTKRINLLDYNFEYKKELIKIANKNKLADVALKNIRKSKKDSIIYKQFLSKIEWRLKSYLNAKIGYEQISPCIYSDKYQTTKFIWLERSNEKSGFFNVDKEYLYARMKFCLDIENRSYFDVYGFLNLTFPLIGKLRKQQNDIVHHIIDNNYIIGLKKHEKDQYKLFELITQNI